MRVNSFTYLSIAPAHAFRAAALPHHHRDPFDRLLIAQARHEGFKLVSRDPHIPLYGVPPLVVRSRDLRHLQRLAVPAFH